MDNYLEVLFRAILAYIILFIFTRIMGKREISQMTFFDYIVGITIGSFTANATLNLNNDFLILVPALIAFSSLQLLTSYLNLKSKNIRKLMEGSYTILIEKGELKSNNLAKERVNIDELQSMLREKNIFSLDEVEYAFMETSGKLSVLKKADQKPVTPNDLGINVTSIGIGHIVIEEGKMNDQELRKLGLTKSWLNAQLSNLGYKDPNQLRYVQIDNNGQLYIDVIEKI